MTLFVLFSTLHRLLFCDKLFLTNCEKEKHIFNFQLFNLQSITNK